ncbi:MAG: hypothetical protein ABJA78_05795 [Ferruginibacter sp.]
MKQVFLIPCFIFFVSISLAQNVGIGTITPSPAAALDISSTAKGLLPPRMTASQRNAIAAPPQGLMIYCTNCGISGEMQVYNGSAWTNMIGGTSTPGIGDSLAGGKVAYIFQAGDPGYVAGQMHGIIIASVEMSGAWGNTPVTGAMATAIGTGNDNTNTIVAAQGAGVYAARLCYDLVSNGYSDWFLPSKDELNKIYLNRIEIGGACGISGGLCATNYWTSSQYDVSNVWIENMGVGTQQVTGKAGNFTVRPIRYF